MPAEIAFSDRITVTNIEMDDLVAECALRLALRDSSQEDIPDFEGPTRRFDTEQALDNYVEVEELSEDSKRYETVAVFDDSGESFDIVFEITQVDDDELEVVVSSSWEADYHDRENIMLDIKTVRKTQEDLLDSMAQVVGEYHFDAENISTVFDGPTGSQVSNLATR